MNSEYYPGWYTVWRQKKTTLPEKKAVIDTMDSIYNSNASFSIYMFHGGTNFGFWNGAEPNGGVSQNPGVRKHTFLHIKIDRIIFLT